MDVYVAGTLMFPDERGKQDDRAVRIAKPTGCGSRWPASPGRQVAATPCREATLAALERRGRAARAQVDAARCGELNAQAEHRRAIADTATALAAGRLSGHTAPLISAALAAAAMAMILPCMSAPCVHSPDGRDDDELWRNARAHVGVGDRVECCQVVCVDPACGQERIAL
jgi:hypothetical protein